MNKEKFNSLDDKTKELILEEMCDLYTIIERNISTVEDLRNFAEWQTTTGKLGDDMKKLLIGICPNEHLDREDILKLSNEAVSLTTWWNGIIKRAKLKRDMINKFK